MDCSCSHQSRNYHHLQVGQNINTAIYHFTFFCPSITNQLVPHINICLTIWLTSLDFMTPHGVNFSCILTLNILSFYYVDVDKLQSSYKTLRPLLDIKSQLVSDSVELTPVRKILWCIIRLLSCSQGCGLDFTNTDATILLNNVARNHQLSLTSSNIWIFF